MEGCLQGRSSADWGPTARLTILEGAWDAPPAFPAASGLGLQVLYLQVNIQDSSPFN